MSEIFRINQHVYRAYPARFFCDGIEISPIDFYRVIRSHYRKA